MRYAEIAINAPVHQTFHYHIPPEMALQPGHLVRVPFGTAMQPGLVVSLDDNSPVEQTKPVLEILDAQPALTSEQIALGLWLSDEYQCPPGAALWLMLPPGLTGSADALLHLQMAEDAPLPSNALQAQLVTLLRERGPLRRSEALRLLGGGTKAQAALKKLEKAALIRSEAMLRPPSVRPRTVRTARLLKPRIDALAGLERAPRQWQIVDYLAQQAAPVDVPEVYEGASADSTDLRKLEAKGLIALEERIVYRDSLADRDFIPSTPLTLLPEQERAWETLRRTIHAQMNPNAREFRGGALPPAQAHFLLHGVTGSGKTELYLYAIAEVLALGRQAIFLVPEIALTPQTIRRVAQRFPGQVAVVHSGLSAGERYDTWRRARDGEIRVIVGTRSALFTPLPRPGLIILDEEHDPSYKQSPPVDPPYYHARRAAGELMRLYGGVLILGSATPDLETMYRAQRGELHYLHLPRRIIGHRERIYGQASRLGRAALYRQLSADAVTMDLPPVKIIDMRDELRAGNRSIFSRELLAALHGVLERQEQAILFLNRRGQATYVFCRDCGYVVTCARCSLPLTYHRAEEEMRCHHCGHSAPTPTRCPECASERIRFFGAGTQQVEEALHEVFPQARSVRWDADTASRPEDHEAILQAFIQGEADVMIGTQMIAKGLDLPLVTLVGVVSADPGLALPDFRAGERVFQVLMQVAGRAGRGVLGGQVLLQTYQPQHASIQAAAGHDYMTFYEREIAARRELGYPPFRRMARLLIHSTHPVEAQRQAEEAARLLRNQIDARGLTDTRLIGPAPCFYTRIDRQFRWQVLLRAADPRLALEGMTLRPNWLLDPDALDVL